MEPPRWFQAPRTRGRSRRRHADAVWRSRWFWVLVGLLAFFYAAGWTLEYLPGLVTAPRVYRLTPAGLALAFVAPAVLAGIGFVSYRWFRRRVGRPNPSLMRPASPVAVSREPIPAGLRFAVLRRDGFRCAYCGRGEPEGVRLHIDHIVPVARGGRNDLDNLVTACADCNLGKSATDLVGDEGGEASQSDSMASIG